MGRETRNSENAAQSSRHLLSHFFCYDISPRSRSEIRLNLYDLHLSAGRVSHGEACARRRHDALLPCSVHCTFYQCALCIMLLPVSTHISYNVGDRDLANGQDPRQKNTAFDGARLSVRQIAHLELITTARSGATWARAGRRWSSTFSSRRPSCRSRHCESGSRAS